MSLKNRIKQIAANSTKPYVSTNTSLTKINTINTSGVITGQVTAYDNISNKYTVVMEDGTVQTCFSGINRLLGPGDGVVIVSGLIIA